jgi:predicted transcriptional regulator
MKTKRFKDSGKDKIPYKSKAKLQKMLETMNVATVAKKCGVTSAAVSYYIKKFGLTSEKIRSKRLNLKIMTVSDSGTKVKKLYDKNRMFKKNMVRTRKHYDLDPWEDYCAEG